MMCVREKEGMGERDVRGRGEGAMGGGRERGETSSRSVFATAREQEKRHPLRTAEYLRNGSEKNIYRRADEVKEPVRTNVARGTRGGGRGRRREREAEVNQKRESDRAH